MSLHERFHSDLNLMIIVGAGTVTAEDFIAVHERERTADSSRDRDVLVDLRQIGGLVIASESFAELIAQDAALHNAGVYTRGRRRVVVGRGEMEEAMVKLFQTLLTRQPDGMTSAAGIRSFDTLRDALAYLERTEAQSVIEAAIGDLRREIEGDR